MLQTLLWRRMTCSLTFLKYPMAVSVQTPATYILMYCNASWTAFPAVRCFQFRKKVSGWQATLYRSSDRTVQHLCLWPENEHEWQFCHNSEIFVTPSFNEWVVYSWFISDSAFTSSNSRLKPKLTDCAFPMLSQKEHLWDIPERRESSTSLSNNNLNVQIFFCCKYSDFSRYNQFCKTIIYKPIIERKL